MNKFVRVTIDGVKTNLLPGVVLICVGIFIVAAYYFVPPAAIIFNKAAELKDRYGFIYSGVATVIFAGIIPFLYLRFTGKIPQGKRMKEFLFYVFFWTYRGIEVDLLYRLQSFFFGNEQVVSVVAKKVIFDQFVYNPLWASPTIMIIYLWKDSDFSFTKLKTKMNKSLFYFRIPSLLVSTWMVWIPSVSIIYCFPASLQIPVFNVIVCFWVLFLSIISSVQDKHGEAMNN